MGHEHKHTDGVIVRNRLPSSCTLIATMILLMSTLTLAIPSSGYGQEETSKSSDLSINVEQGVSTRNVWRGLDYGSSPSVWGDLYGSFKGFSLGAMGTTTLNGSKAQYGTWLELYASYTFKNVSLVIDDYFFFNPQDQDNNYFDYNVRKLGWQLTS